MGHPLDSLYTIQEYSNKFCDASIWSPYVAMICERHGLTPFQPIHAGIPGTFPTFIAGNRWVIKFYGPLFNGAASFEAERSVNQLIQSCRHTIAQEITLSPPDLITAGQLLDNHSGWPWPYLVFQYLPGVSIGEVYDQVAFSSKCRLANDLGRWSRWLHSLDLSRKFTASPSKWESYSDFIDRQRRGCSERHAGWGSLPPRLVGQIDRFLSSAHFLQPGEGTHLIHADLTADHILGEVHGQAWRSRGVIDFGDARLGSRYYELGALHLNLFKGDKRLLASFLQGYGVYHDPVYQGLSPKQFAREAMAAALIHQFNIFENAAAIVPDLNTIDTLDQLTERLWLIPR